jgi:hypothetical protein
MTQAELVAGYIREHKVATSDELRNVFHYADVPKAVSIAIREYKFPITSKRNPNGSALYTWQGKPILQFNDFIFDKNGHARLREPDRQLEL